MGPGLPSARCYTREDFNPPIPCGMGPASRKRFSTRSKFQSTHPVWDGTVGVWRFRTPTAISIHPSRVGWDRLRSPSPPRSVAISIHPSRVGWDDTDGGIVCWHGRFQSTHPVWDGTKLDDAAMLAELISIHPSRVGWDYSASRAALLEA